MLIAAPCEMPSALRTRTPGATGSTSWSCADSVAAAFSWLTRPQLFICGHNPEWDSRNRFSCHAIVIRDIGRLCADSCIGLITFDEFSPQGVVTTDELIRTAEVGLDVRYLSSRGVYYCRSKKRACEIMPHRHQLHYARSERKATRGWRQPSSDGI